MGSDLGKRYECFNCRTKFYDLGKERAVCPKCESDQEEAVKSQETGGRKKTSRGKKAREPVFDDFDTPHDEGSDALKEAEIPIDLKANLE